jgi:phage gpG-like protein
MRRALHAAALTVVRRAKINLSGRFLRVRTQRLRSSVTHVVRQEAGGLVAQIGTNVFYGRLHEFGTVPHEIRPIRAKVLRFFVAGQKEPVFARFVRHPGHRARPWLRTALEESGPDIRHIFGDHFGRFIRGGGRA